MKRAATISNGVVHADLIDPLVVWSALVTIGSAIVLSPLTGLAMALVLAVSWLAVRAMSGPLSGSRAIKRQPACIVVSNA